MAFRIGDRVTAKTFGAGIIVTIEDSFHLVAWDNLYVHGYNHIIDGYKYTNCYGLSDYELQLEKERDLKEEIYAKVKYLGDKHAV